MANRKKIFLDKKGALGLRPLIISLFICVLVAIAAIYFAIGFIQANNPTSDVLNSNNGLNSSANKLVGSMQGLTNYANYSQTVLAGSSPSLLQYVFLIFEGAFRIPWFFLSAGVSTISLLVTTVFPFFGGTGTGLAGILVTGVVIASMTVTIVFLIIKMIRTGETER